MFLGVKNYFICKTLAKKLSFKSFINLYRTVFTSIMLSCEESLISASPQDWKEII